METRDDVPSCVSQVSTMSKHASLLGLFLHSIHSKHSCLGNIDKETNPERMFQDLLTVPTTSVLKGFTGLDFGPWSCKSSGCFLLTAPEPASPKHGLMKPSHLGIRNPFAKGGATIEELRSSNGVIHLTMESQTSG